MERAGRRQGGRHPALGAARLRLLGGTAPVLNQSSVTDVCPGELTVTAPPHEHEHCDESSSAGTPPIVASLEPGVHGLNTGTHGCGVNVPDAAAVADATCGFASDV